MRIITTAVAAVLVLAGAAIANFEVVQLTRDEVGVYKKKLVSVQAAMGQPPAGYAKDSDNFNLRTQIDKVKGKDLYYLSVPDVQTNYSGNKLKEASDEEMQKKMSDAMARGDFQAVQQLAASGQANAGQQEKEPIHITITLNSDDGRNIDPDNVVVEKPGMLGLITESREEKRTTLMMFFDPVRLKDTKALSRVSLAPSSDSMKERTVAGKTVVQNVLITLTGPAEEVKAWAKKVDLAAVLKQIDGK